MFDQSQNQGQSQGLNPGQNPVQNQNQGAAGDTLAGLEAIAGQGGANDALEIHTIPNKFKTQTSQPKSGGSRVGLWILGIIIFLALIGGGAYLFVTEYGPGQNVEPAPAPAPTPVPTPEPTPEPVPEPTPVEPEFISERQALTGRIEDENKMMLAQMKLVLPEGAIAEDFSIDINPNDEIKEDANAKYQVIGGTYAIDTDGVSIGLEKPAELSLYYAKDLIAEELEKHLTVGYKTQSGWKALQSSVDKNRDMVRANQSKFLESEYALIIPIETYNQDISDKGVESMIDIKTVDTKDQDEDGLTDIEEAMFTTNIANKDTDQDSYDDRTEIINLYSPKGGDGLTLLTETELVKTYAMKSGYQVMLPVSFVVSDMSTEDDLENTMIATDRSEFFQITTQNNPELMSIREWYMTQVDGVSYAQLELQDINGFEAIVSPDSTSVYIGIEDKVYVLTYGIATSQEIAYETTFEMVVRSFKAVR